MKYLLSFFNDRRFIPFVFAVLAFSIYQLAGEGYGYFRDELYYLITSEHPAFGYVDMQPFIAVIAKVITSILGVSIIGIRLLPAIAGAAIVYVTGLIIIQLSDRNYSLVLGLIGVTFAPVILGVCGFLSMNCFDLLFCTLALYQIALYLKKNDTKYFIYFGIICGVGLQNKLSPLFIAFGLLIGLLSTEHRKVFLDKNIWIGGGIAIIIFLPFVIWQRLHNFPMLEFMSNVSKYKNASFTPLEFFTEHILEINPINIIFIAAALFLLFTSKGKSIRLLVLIYLSILILFMATNAKPYYIARVNPMIIAVGASAAGDYIAAKWRKGFQILFIVCLLPGYIILTPLALPLLEPDNFIEYADLLGIRTKNIENQRLGSLPQHYADMFGWEEMAKEVSKVYLSLTDVEKSKVIVFGQNYGEASAINFFSKDYSLPIAVSGHNNYWIWGYPKDYTGEIMIVIGSTKEDNSEFFEDVELAGQTYNKYRMPYENVQIFICRNMKMPIAEVWKRIKLFI